MHTLRYTEGYRPQSGARPGSLTLTLLVGGAVVSAMFFVSPKFVQIPETVLKTTNIRLDPPPPPDPVTKPKQQPKLVQPPQQREIFTPPPPLPLPLSGPTLDSNPTPPDTHTLEGVGTVPTHLDPPRPSVVTGAEFDQRYAANFQPTYPADAIRDGRDGHVTVKVLIGTDGHVLQVEKVSAPSESFFEATRRRALEKWRFKPATRDGVPYETWKTVGVSFVLNQE